MIPVMPFDNRSATARTLGAVTILAAPFATHAEPISFNNDIRPILSENCFQCHGPDEDEREAGLRLDREDGSRADLGGYAAVVPGKPGASEIISRITTENRDDLMPPPKSKKKLSAAEKALIRRWVEEGGAYEKHWAFEPVARTEPPGVKDESWPRNAIDHFILQRLEANGIRPAPEADRNTLIRRLYLDLTGLLPSPEEVDAFVDDSRAGAYERLVDRLLSSPHHGERWGRHWLDQARYADSNGYTIDPMRIMWPYRDWVINAVNEDMPFDRFTIEQIAGDLLPEPGKEQLIATGFHRNTLINNEGGTDGEQFRNESVVDRVNTTAAVWLGLTLGCAQCHAHKFDPLSQEEYYRLFAFFNSTEDVNNTGPQILVKAAPRQDRIEEIDRLVKEHKAAAKEKQSESPADKEPREIRWQVLDPVKFNASSGAVFEELEDRSLLVSGTREREDVYEIGYRIPTQKIAALRLEALPDDSLPRGGPGRADNGNFILTEVELSGESGKPLSWLKAAAADYSQPGHDVSRAVDGDPKTGWAINTNQKGNVKRSAVFTLAETFDTGENGTLELRLVFWQQSRPYTLGRFRVAVTDDVSPSAEPDREETIKDLLAEKRKLEAQAVHSMIMRQLKEPRPTHVLLRGDFLRKGDPVQPGTPAILHPLETSAKEATRLDLAKWLVDRENSLTPRVTVNRVWQKYFGTGLVATENDFGTQGTPPTHPELLDWLAREFVSCGWSMKELHRLIVSSATYRQSSAARPDLEKVDPLNRLLARQVRLRVEAEIVRDLALSASGRLVPKIGGPPVFPPQPDGVYAFTQTKKEWNTSEGEDRYRRTMYTFFYRSAPHPMLTTFDTPRFNATCTQRLRSNTPLQSLMVANDAGLFELAQGLAMRLLEEDHPDAKSRLARAFRLCLCREPAPAESEQLLAYLEEQARQFERDNVAATAIAPPENSSMPGLPQAAAWTATARVLFNLDEFITRE